jgi:fused signal recognition particle receptor
MFSFFRTTPKPTPAETLAPASAAAQTPTPRQTWLGKLKAGLRKTGGSIAAVFTGTQIDEALYEELETALLMADTGVKATEHLLKDLKARVKAAKVTEPVAVKALLIEAITDLLMPLQKQLTIGNQKPMVIMVAGVNGAGKTTSIGKLTHHLAQAVRQAIGMDEREKAAIRAKAEALRANIEEL